MEAGDQTPQPPPEVEQAVLLGHLEEAVSLSDRVVVMSASPGRAIGNYPITLARPRNMLEIRFEPEFTETYQRIWEQLRAEVVRSNAD